MARRVHEIDDIETFARFVARPHASLRHTVVEGLDLSAYRDLPGSLDVTGAIFLGCQFLPDTATALRSEGALLFPAIPEVPFDPYQGELYDAEELFDADRYDKTFDAQVYAWSQRARSRRPLADSLATALHDHAIETALDQELADVPAGGVVGIMGGHGMSRTDASYAEAVRLARDLTRAGRVVLTGGGPGAMEAANLGAWIAAEPDDLLDEALAILAEAPSFRPSIDAWTSTAARVRALVPEGGRSIGIPTWFYGHEPPNLFASRIAKFFANPIREATLLARCDGGIVYLPGAAGTVQEIFADACENYYASPADMAPMVLVGRGWVEDLPAWPLLRALADRNELRERVCVVDRPQDALAPLGVPSHR